MRLCAILNKLQVMLFTNLTHTVHLTGLSIQVNDQNCLCLIRDRLFNLTCIDSVLRIRLYKYRGRSIDCHTHDTCNVRIGLYNDFIPSADAECTKC